MASRAIGSSTQTRLHPKAQPPAWAPPGTERSQLPASRSAGCAARPPHLASSLHRSGRRRRKIGPNFFLPQKLLIFSASVRRDLRSLANFFFLLEGFFF
ncbi:hypothetical protein BS78_03G154000 [Paspalum vaginatum]|nr:hypothetical protein BS78_03G154000 [Paspalum vaginatum]